ASLAVPRSPWRPRPVRCPRVRLVAHPLGPHRRDRALHRDPGPVGPGRREAGRGRYRPHHAGPAALARGGGGRTSRGRLRPVHARGRWLHPSCSDHGGGRRGLGLPVGTRGAFPHRQRPSPSRKDRRGQAQGVLGTARRQKGTHPPPGPPDQGGARVPASQVPPVAERFHRPGRGLPRRFPRGTCRRGRRAGSLSLNVEPGHRIKHSSEYYANPRSPVGLFQQDRPDRFMLVLGRLASRLEPLMSRLGPGRSAPAPGEDLSVRVTRVEHPSSDVATLTLVPSVPGTTLPAWQPGHHVDVLLGEGVLRQYSLNGDPDDRSRYRIAVRRIEGGVGSGLVHKMSGGEVVGLRGPRNAYPFVPAERYLFGAGGIGITPILPMVKAAHAARRPFRLVYTGRSRNSMPFLDELPEDADVFVRPDDEYGA